MFQEKRQEKAAERERKQEARQKRLEQLEKQLQVMNEHAAKDQSGDQAGDAVGMDSHADDPQRTLLSAFGTCKGMSPMQHCSSTCGCFGCTCR